MASSFLYIPSVFFAPITNPENAIKINNKKNNNIIKVFLI